jgi:hypothetical protein
MDDHVTGRVDTEAHLAPTRFENRDDDVVPDDD